MLYAFGFPNEAYTKVLIDAWASQFSILFRNLHEQDIRSDEMRRNTSIMKGRSDLHVFKKSLNAVTELPRSSF